MLKFRKRLWELCLAYSSFISTYIAIGMKSTCRPQAFGDYFPSNKGIPETTSSYLQRWAITYFSLMIMWSNINLQRSMETLMVSLDCQYKKNHQTWKLYVHWNKNSSNNCYKHKDTWLQLKILFCHKYTILQ